MAAEPKQRELVECKTPEGGVLARRESVRRGAVRGWKASPLDRGYTMKSALAQLRARTPTPLLTGLPFGHVHPKVTLPVGRKVQLLVQRREVLVAWGHGD